VLEQMYVMIIYRLLEWIHVLVLFWRQIITGFAHMRPARECIPYLLDGHFNGVGHSMENII
jgi:hypothetical protein